MQNDLDNLYMKKSAALFAINFTKLPVVKLSILFPVLNPLLIFVLKSSIILTDLLRRLVPSLMRCVQISPLTWIIEQVREVVKTRLESGTKRMDLLQLMLDAAKSEEAQVNLFSHEDD